METPKTFAQLKNKSWNWNRVLKMRIPKYFDQETADMIRDAEERAGDWVTCAVGNQCSIIPRDREGEPLDAKLRDFGIDFSRKIEILSKELNNAFNYNYLACVGALKIANDTMDKIEERSLILIMKELEKQNK